MSGSFALEHLVHEPSHSVELEGEGPVNVGLIILKVVITDHKVDATGVEECLASVSVSIKVRGGCWSDSRGKGECGVRGVRCMGTWHRVIFGIKEDSFFSFWFII